MSDQARELGYPRSARLSEEQCARLHEASLEVLARTGIRFYHAGALDLFHRGGAEISDGNLVRIPRRLVEWALGAAPKNIPIYDRLGRLAMELRGYRAYFGPGSDCMYIFDLESGRRRLACLQDVKDGVRLVDALPNLDFVMSMFLPADVPTEHYERIQMAAMLQESSKPIVFVGNKANSTRYSVEMAAAVVGGLGELEARPFVINYVNTTSSFHHNEESVERLLYAAQHNVPTVYSPGNARGTTSPMTVAGNMILGNAGHMAGLALSQLQREGSPFIRNNPAGIAMDMRTMVSLYAAPDGGPFGWDLSHHLGLPIFGTAGASDAKVFDAQAAGEVALTLFHNAIHGANLIHDLGYLDCAMTGSLELLTYCDELVGWLKRYLRLPEIDEETMALETIMSVGPDGSFLDRQHTLRHVRDDWRPTLMDRLDYSRWAEKGATTLQQRANQKAKSLIRDHQAPALPASLVKALDDMARN